MPNELKLCPFCGGKAKVYEYTAEQAIYDKDTLAVTDIEERASYAVGCPECGCIIADRPSEEQAIEDWGRRADNA